MKTTCPTCGDGIEFEKTRDVPDFPFCSERCRLLDLGKWMDGSYRLSRGLNEDDLMDLDPEELEPQEE